MHRHAPHRNTFLSQENACQTGLSSTTTGTAKLASNREESPADLPWRGQGWNILAANRTYCIQISVIDRKITQNQQCTIYYYQKLLLSIIVNKNQHYYYLLLSITVLLNKY